METRPAGEPTDAHGSRSSRQRREEAVRVLLIAAWLVFGISSTFWLPIYKGTASLEPLSAIYALIAVFAGFAVRQRARDTAHAVMSALPSICFVALAGLAAALLDEGREAVRGEPLYLYAGIALLASWATLVLATALGARTLWTQLGALLLTLIVVLIGFGLMTLRID